MILCITIPIMTKRKRDIILPGSLVGGSMVLSVYKRIMKRYNEAVTKGLEENRLLYEFPKTVTMSVTLFEKRAGKHLPAPRFLTFRTPLTTGREYATHFFKEK